MGGYENEVLREWYRKCLEEDGVITPAESMVLRSLDAVEREVVHG